jgi:bla regulator protein blaR1
MPRFPRSIDSRMVTASALLLSLVLVIALPTPALSTGHSTKNDDDFEYAVIVGEHETVCSVSVSSSWKEIDRLGDRYDGPIVWFRMDKRGTYVIRDPQWVQHAREIIGPMNQLGQKQGELGRLQGDIGSRQGNLGVRQAEIGQRQAELGARLDAIQETIERRRDRGESTTDLERDRAAIERDLRELENEERSISEEQDRLGAKQDELGKRQNVLGQEQERATEKARGELRTLAEQALAKRFAEPVPK